MIKNLWLCVIVFLITFVSADFVLRKYLHFPSHYLEEIITLRRPPKEYLPNDFILNGAITNRFAANITEKSYDSYALVCDNFFCFKKPLGKHERS